jgi:lambda repressor-like predicted transcriptional regulator
LSDYELLDGEVFVDLEGFNGYYLISNKGRCWNTVKQLFMKQADNGAGYKFYMFRPKNRDVKYFRAYVHRLVAKHFIDNPEDKSYVNHKDSDRSNNSAENLEWVTAKENTAHGVNAGRINGKLRGKTNQLTDKQRIESVMLRKLGLGITHIANQFGLSRTTLSSVFNGRSNPELVELVTDEIEGVPDWQLKLSLNCN